MFLCLHLLASEDLLDDSFLVDDEGGANGSHRLLAIHILLAPCAHCLKQGVVDIGNQRKWQLMLLLELLMGGGTILTNPHYLIACTL